MSPSLFTIGHSNHEAARFVELLQQHRISVVADVRSQPWSRHTPQYSRERFRPMLAAAGIGYVFLGEELGARSRNPDCYREGRVHYPALAREPGFLAGLQRVRDGLQRHRIALMCAEKDPLQCHRALLVGRALFEGGQPVDHIHADGALEDHEALQARLLEACRLPAGDMFTSREQFVAQAYLLQGERVAYQDQAIHEDLAGQDA